MLELIPIEASTACSFAARRAYVGGDTGSRHIDETNQRELGHTGYRSCMSTHLNSCIFEGSSFPALNVANCQSAGQSSHASLTAAAGPLVICLNF